MSIKAPKPKNWIQYYDDRDILDEITDEPANLFLDEHLREDVVSGKRRRKLKKITIKQEMHVVHEGLGYILHTKSDILPYHVDIHS